MKVDPDPEEAIPESIIPQTEDVASLKEYLQSIVIMPWSLRILCLTNLFCWMAHVCYSLYFTDFVGEAVFGGDPKVPYFYYCYLPQDLSYLFNFRQWKGLKSIICMRKGFGMVVGECPCTHYRVLVIL